MADLVEHDYPQDYKQDNDPCLDDFFDVGEADPSESSLDDVNYDYYADNDYADFTEESAACPSTSNMQECMICMEYFENDDIFVPVFCSHNVCKACACTYYEMQIKNFGVLNVVCPVYGCIDISKMSSDEAQQYFAYTETQLREILSKDTLELLEKKLRDWSLAKSADMLWCPRCENGVIIEDFDSGNIYLCSNCGCHICLECKVEWTKEHEGLTCENYKIWKDSANERNDKKLKSYLAEHGLECPKCRTKFIKPSGGCLHLTCSEAACKHQFCEGCLQPFKHGKDCKVSSLCVNWGFHAHHPRNCFYFLRDWNPIKLEALLKRHNIKFNRERLQVSDTCDYMEQKETKKGLIDEPCGLKVQPFENGYCRKHYLGYLGQLVLKYNIDPIDEYDLAELKLCLKKSNIPFPNETQDRNLLIQKIKGRVDLQDAVVTGWDTKIKNSWENIEIENEHLLQVLEDSAKRLQAYDEDDDYDSFEDECCAPPLPKKIEQAKTWVCCHCTFVNAVERKICDICCRTRNVGQEEYEIWEDGIECGVCTLVNIPTVQYCEACGQKLGTLV